MGRSSLHPPLTNPSKVKGCTGFKASIGCSTEDCDWSTQNAISCLVSFPGNSDRDLRQRGSFIGSVEPGK